MRRTLPIAIILVTSVVGTVASQRADALDAYRAGRLEDAVTITLAEIAEQPSNLDAYSVLGWSLLDLGRFSEAIEYGTQALNVRRTDPRIIHIVAAARYATGDLSGALTLLQQYAALAPNGSVIDQVYYMMGEVHARYGELNHADIAISTAVRLEASAPALWWQRLGEVREEAGWPAGARVAYTEALRRDPALVAAREGLGRLPVSGQR